MSDRHLEPDAGDDTELSSRRARKEAVGEDTVLGSRRRAATDEGDLSADLPEEHTVLGSRRRAAAHEAEASADLPEEHTVLGSRRRAGVAEPEEHTVLGSRRRAETTTTADTPALDDTVLGSVRHAPPTEQPIGGVTDGLGTTHAVAPMPGPRSAERPDVDDTVASILPAPAVDDTAAVPSRRSNATGVEIDASPRRASMPDQAILKAPYRPRDISTTAPVRLPELPRPVLPASRAVPAAQQDKRRSRRGFVAIVVIGGVLVVGALVGVIWLIVPLLTGS